MSDDSTAGLGCIAILVAVSFPVVWIGGCAVEGYNKMQRGRIYKEVWKKAPELERVHGGLSAELARLHDFRQQLEKSQQVFESPAAKEEAGRKITAVNAQIARLEAQRLAIISSVEQQALTHVSTKVENPMQREMISRLESETQSVTRDAESLRQAIEAGVSEDSLADAPEPEPSKAVPPPEPQPDPDRVTSPNRDPYGREAGAEAGSGAKTRPGTPRVSRESSARLFEPRIWNDRYGHRVTARLLHVADARGNAVATLGTDPIDIAASDWVVHLQRQDGAIIRVPAVKFSSRDLDFLSEGE